MSDLASMAFVQLPHVNSITSGRDGYYCYSPSDRQYGSPRTVGALIFISQNWRRANPQLPIGIGDMSFENGTQMPPHQGHRKGVNADLRPLRKDRRNLPVTILDANYDREATAQLVMFLKNHPNVQSILFNDTLIKGVQSWPGHNNHLHVKMHF
jgi:penicillin-insensitive murein endopeptidase